MDRTLRVWFHALEELPKGGHFAAWGQPKFLSEEIRAGFRSLRQS